MKRILAELGLWWLVLLFSKREREEAKELEQLCQAADQHKDELRQRATLDAKAQLRAEMAVAELECRDCGSHRVARRADWEYEMS